jgi:dTDP-4-dehydrorhamnose reductase
MYQWNASEEVDFLLKDLVPELVINCIKYNGKGITTPDYFRVNSALPRNLSKCANDLEISVVNISTNAVFSGISGDYVESSLAFPKSVYGLSKLMGESRLSNTINLRVSPIGINRFSTSTRPSFVERLSELPRNAKLSFSKCEYWNGVTCDALSKILVAYASVQTFIPNTQHVFSHSRISKYELARLICDKIGRLDIRLIEKRCTWKSKMTLSTNFPVIHKNLWLSTGYTEVPRIDQLVSLLNL